MNNLHWVVSACDKMTLEETGEYRIHFVIQIQVKHQNNEENAIARAKEIIKRKHYWITNVIECDCAKESLQRRKHSQLIEEQVKLIKKQFPNEE